MPPRHILSPQSRAALFDPPTDPAAIVRHYTFSSEDLALIRQRRRAANRLGFAVNLAYLRFPGRVLDIDEAPPADMLTFSATQIGCDPADFGVYARRDETRREHLGELQAYLAVRPFQREDKRAVAHVAIEQATGSDRGDAIVSAMIEHLRGRRILLPTAAALEKMRSRRVPSLANVLTRISSKACRQKRSRDWRRCASSPTIKIARRSLGCANGRKRCARKIWRFSSRGCNSCESLAYRTARNWLSTPAKPARRIPQCGRAYVSEQIPR